MIRLGKFEEKGSRDIGHSNGRRNKNWFLKDSTEAKDRTYEADKIDSVMI